MKKSILIGALAALMLFAFVACDGSGSASALEENIITGLAVTSDVPTVFKGETIEEDDLTVVATTVAGTTRTLSSDEFTFTPNYSMTSEDETLEDKEDKSVIVGYVTYDGYSYTDTSGIRAEVKANVYTLDKIAVTAPSTPQTYYTGWADQKVDYTPYTVTGTALGENDVILYSRALVAEDEYTATLSGTDTAGKGTLTFKPVSALDSDSAVAAATTSVIVRTDKVDSVVLATKSSYEVIAGTAVPTSKADLEKIFDVTVNYISGKTESYPATGVSIDFTGTVAGSTSTQVMPSNGSVSAKAKYSGVESNSVSVQITPNYVKTFTATYKTGKVVAAGDSVVNGNVEVTATSWAADNGTKPTGDLAFTVHDPVMPDLEEGAEWEFMVTLDAYPQAGFVMMPVEVGAETSEAEA